MGDRIIVVFTDASGSYSPGIYLHWAGWEGAKTRLIAAAPRMRRADAGYAAARYCGHCHESITGALSLGLVDAPKASKAGRVNWRAYADQFDTNNGIMLVNIGTGDVRNVARNGDGWTSFNLYYHAKPCEE